MKNSTASSSITSSLAVLVTIFVLLSFVSVSLGRPPKPSYSDYSEEVYQDRLIFPDEIPRLVPKYQVKSISRYPQNAYYTTNSLGGSYQSDASSDILSEEETGIENEFDFRLGDSKRKSYSSTKYFQPCVYSSMRGDENSRFSSSNGPKFLPCGSNPQGTKG